MLRALCQGLATGWTSSIGLSGGLLALARVVSLGAIAGCLERWGAVGAGLGVRLGVLLGILVAHRTCADPSRAHAHKHIQTYRHIHTQASDALTQARTRTHTTNDTHTHARSHTHIQLAMPRGPLAMGKYSRTKSEEDSGHVHM